MIELPVLATLAEARRILAQLVAEDALDRADAAMLGRVFERVSGAFDRLHPPMQPLHGDAHLGNVLNTRRGPLWCDLEDTFVGPIGWDLACLVGGSRIYGTDTERRASGWGGVWLYSLDRAAKVWRAGCPARIPPPFSPSGALPARALRHTR